MPSDGPLDQIWQSYQVLCDSLRIAQRTVSRDNIALLNSTVFMTDLKDRATDQIKKGRNDVNDYIILSLWASFERRIMDYLQQQGDRLLSPSLSEFNKRIHKKISKEIEYWKIDDILDIFKGLVEPKLIGQAKQIKQYRDWVAHRNINKEKPPNIAPEKAYSILSKILNILEIEFGF